MRYTQAFDNMFDRNLLFIMHQPANFNKNQSKKNQLIEVATQTTAISSSCGPFYIKTRLILRLIFMDKYVLL